MIHDINAFDKDYKKIIIPKFCEKNSAFGIKTLEDTFYELLCDNIEWDWVNNEGGFGSLKIDLQDESITIDQFDLPILILWTCTLVPDWTGLKKPEGFPNELAQVLEVGTNGVWKMPFYTPVSDWLIQRRKQRNKRLKDTPVYESYEISTHSMSDYILTDDDHKVISEIRNLLDE